MRWAVLAVSLLAAACGPAVQPESGKTVAAFEVPLPTENERAEFIAMLRSLAQPFGMHVYAESKAELDETAKAIPEAKLTINAAVWRGADDEELVASVMDFHDHLGQAWITFAKGTDTQLSRRFRDRVMQEIRRRWPGTLSLPIMPSGAIPLHDDLLRTPAGYIVKPSEASRYAKSQ